MRLVEFIPRVTTGDDSTNAVSNPHNVRSIVHYVDTIKDCFTAPVYDEPQTITSTDRSEWQAQALEMLSEFRDKKAWAAAYLTCGRCYRGFMEWLEQNPVGDGWVERAQKIILENRWL